MRILLLSEISSSHTLKWAISLADNSIDIMILGLSSFNSNLYNSYSNIQIENLGLNKNIVRKKDGHLSKLKYLKTIFKVKKIIKEFKPDIVHAHYASSYGILGALSGFKPFILSVWGSDIFDFPNKSPLHKKIVKYNLRKADKILSTSNIMALEINKYTDKPVIVTPFGIDTNIFNSMKGDSLFKENDIVIGTVKTLDEKYGIVYLIKAFKILVDKYPKLPLKLLIVGKGSQENSLKDLVSKLDISDKTIFTGGVDYADVPKYHNMLSVSVSVSNSESFGVAIIEASACEKPVIVSNAGGLPEVVQDGVTGIIVPPRDEVNTAKAIERLIFDKKLLSEMGKQGRQRVIKYYNWDNNIKQMINIYKDSLQI